MSEAVADERPPGPFFPDLPAFRLSGRRLRLPSALEATAVLVVSFDPAHRALSSEWVERAVAELDDVPVLEVAVFSRADLWRRGVIDGGMIDGIGDLTILRRTVTVYADLDAFCTATGVEDRSTVAVLVTEPTGTVRGCVSGPVDDDRWAVVSQAVAPQVVVSQGVAVQPAAGEAAR